MGICSSCEATAVMSLTAKLVSLPDGKLQEFDRPVKVSHVLQKLEPSATRSFVCNSDNMEFDGVVTALHGDEELQMGQLYFLLPTSMLRKPLSAEEMAAVAVKASTALIKATGCTHYYRASQHEQKHIGAAASSEGADHSRRIGMAEEIICRNDITNRRSREQSRSVSTKRASAAACGSRGGGRHFNSDLGPITE